MYNIFKTIVVYITTFIGGNHVIGSYYLALLSPYINAENATRFSTHDSTLATLDDTFGATSANLRTVSNSSNNVYSNFPATNFPCIFSSTYNKNASVKKFFSPSFFIRKSAEIAFNKVVQT